MPAPSATRAESVPAAGKKASTPSTTGRTASVPRAAAVVQEGDIKLYYYSFGGRAGAIRLVLNHAGIPFDDVRIDWSEMDAAMAANPARFPMQTIPVMEINAALLDECSTSGGEPCERKEIVTLSQSIGMLNLACRLGGFAPRSALEQALSDEFVLTNEDIQAGMVATMFDEGEKLKASREKFVSGVLRRGLQRMDTLLADSRLEGPFLLGETPSAGEFALFVLNLGFAKGYMDHVPPAIASDYPNVKRMLEALASLSSVKSYMEKHPDC